MESYAWKALRKTKLDEQPNCEICWVPANTVHHLSYERLWKEHESDLASVCYKCHDNCHSVWWYQIKNSSSELNKRFQELQELSNVYSLPFSGYSWKELHYNCKDKYLNDKKSLNYLFSEYIYNKEREWFIIKSDEFFQKVTYYKYKNNVYYELIEKYDSWWGWAWDDWRDKKLLYALPDKEVEKEIIAKYIQPNSNGDNYFEISMYQLKNLIVSDLFISKYKLLKINNIYY